MWILNLFFVLCNSLIVNGILSTHANVFGITIPSPGDKLVFLRGEEVKTILGLDQDNVGLLSMNPEFKCHVLNALTKWCGQGNVAENYHDLGQFNGSDACCRDHDFCDDVINAGRTKHNLVNPYGTTRLHCKCDEDLRQCFRKVNSIIANTIGYIFFSLLQTQCFDFEHPTNGCEVWKRGAVRQYCVKYKLLKDQPKKWQWFDQEPYF